MPADLDLVADELYSLPRDEFTAARNAAAKKAKKQGERELAEQIAALRRPSTAAWLANLLAREHPDEVGALVELGDGLRAAQEQLEGDALRRLSQQRHELVHGLVQQARTLARSAGHPASDAVARELEDTFTAAANSSAAAQAVAGGRLTAPLDPADTTSLEVGATDAPKKSRPKRDDDRSERDERLRRDLERARSEADSAGTARDEAQRVLTGAEQELRARLDAVEQAEHEARRSVRSAQRDVDTTDRAAREAQRRVQDLERRLGR
jgi:hypothetical protein